MWKSNRIVARRRRGWMVGVAIVVAVIALPLSSQHALAYHLEGPIWGGQPSPGTCCAHLYYKPPIDAQSYDNQAWYNALNAWNVSPAYIIYYSSSTGLISMTDTYNSSVSWNGITEYTSSGCCFSNAIAYLNYYYTSGFHNSGNDGGIQTIAAHELGHVAGLAHTDNGPDGIRLMDPYPYADTWLGYGINTPQPDDVNGIDALY